jgi:hypothetical protein
MCQTGRGSGCRRCSEPPDEPILVTSRRGTGWTSSTGMAAGTDADGDVRIRCPDEIAPI